MAGRKPKPTSIKKLEGNPGKRKLNEREPTPEKKAPKCPTWLLPEAKKEWRRLAKVLEQMGILTKIDMTAFAGYCQSYARWKQAEETISEIGSTFTTPSGYRQQIPEVGISSTSLKMMHKFAAEFGLTPSARSRIIANSEENFNEEDPMELLLLNGGKK